MTNKPVALKNALTSDQQEALSNIVNEAERALAAGPIQTRYFIIKKGDVLKAMLAKDKAQRNFLKEALRVLKDVDFKADLTGLSASDTQPGNLRLRFASKPTHPGLVRTKNTRELIYQLRAEQTNDAGRALLALLTFDDGKKAKKSEGKKSKSLEEQIGVYFGFPYFARQAATYRVLPLTGVIAISMPWADVSKEALKAYKKLEKAGVRSSAEFELLTTFKHHKSLTEVRQSKYIEAFEKEQDKVAKAKKKSEAKKAKAEKESKKAAKKEAKRAESAPKTMAKGYGKKAPAKKAAKKSAKKSAKKTVANTPVPLI